MIRDKKLNLNNYSIGQLINKADMASKDRSFFLAETLIKEAIKQKPDDPYIYSKLCDILRMSEKPKKALKATDDLPFKKNLPFLTSRAAAMCDLGMYKRASREIAPVLAEGYSCSKVSALRIVKRIKRNAPGVYKVKGY